MTKADPEPKQPRAPAAIREVLGDNVWQLTQRRYAEKPSKTAMLRQLAADSDIGYGTLGRIIDGTTETGVDKLERLAICLDVLPYQLLLFGLDPDNPQAATDPTAAERRWYGKVTGTNPTPRSKPRKKNP